MAENLLNDFLRTSKIKHKKSPIKAIDFLLDNNCITMDKKANKLFINLPLIEHIFDNRFIGTYELPPAEAVNFYHHYVYDNDYGYVIWIIKKMNTMPRANVAEFLNGLRNRKGNLMYDLKLMNLKGNIEK